MRLVSSRSGDSRRSAPDDGFERLQTLPSQDGLGFYVGLAEDCYVVASEPYGLVEETSRFVRMDGETPADPVVRIGAESDDEMLASEEVETPNASTILFA